MEVGIELSREQTLLDGVQQSQGVSDEESRLLLKAMELTRQLERRFKVLSEHAHQVNYLMYEVRLLTSTQTFIIFTGLHELSDT